jgi:ParB-like chromosome segregation protein Spo0J
VSAAKQDVRWEGERSLRRLLVDVSTLRPYPGNPRRGDVVRIAESLTRFGQVRPIVVDAEGKIVAGNHTFLAARELGWNRVAAVKVDMSDEDALAYLVADNRLSDVAVWDDSELRSILERLRDAGALTGTGYTPEEAEDYFHELDVLAARARQLATAPDEFPLLDPDALAIEHRCPRCGYEWSGKSSAQESDDG